MSIYSVTRSSKRRRHSLAPTMGFSIQAGWRNCTEMHIIGICFSATNYSLVPQEMMACGLPVIEIEGESTRAVFPEDVVTLTGPHPCAIADSIEALLRDLGAPPAPGRQPPFGGSINLVGKAPRNWSSKRCWRN